jgi:molybdopterin synthase sulfur carrier subunit
LRYFASLREQLGAAEDLEVAPGTTVAAVRDMLIARGGGHAATMARHRAVRCAMNQTLCTEDTVVTEGVELAFFPPVTGG